MSRYKYLAPFVITLLAIIGICTHAPRERDKAATTINLPVAAVADVSQSSASTRGSRIIPASVPTAQERPAPTISPVPAATTTASAAFKVGDAAYPIEVTSGEKVIALMRALAEAGTLSFTGRDYPAFGFFVDSINGKKNANGYYWMLYRNGISETVGASSAEIEVGDTIEWKYEKGY